MDAGRAAAHPGAPVTGGGAIRTDPGRSPSAEDSPERDDYVREGTNVGLRAKPL